MKHTMIIVVLCSVMSMGLFAQNNAKQTQNNAKQTTSQSDKQRETHNATANNVSEAKQKYTFGDFFDALDLPTVLGVGFTPNGIEGATFNSAMRLGWRHHKNYGTFVYITYDTHSNKYEDLDLQFAGSNFQSAEVWYNEIGMSVGYRFPLVKDIKAFYENPYFHPWDVFVSVQPGVSIATLKNAVMRDDPEGSIANTQSYDMESLDHAVPTLRFSAGVEWFIMSNFGVFAEAAYTQHLMPTVIEQAAINKGEIKHPSGPITVSIGLSLFFN